jgi:uncharacterized UPF0160 family protein
MQSGKTIGTHDGVFHADDAMGCMLLKNYTNDFKNGQIVRSRNPEVLNKLDVVIDVGGIYDFAMNRFDHHQKGFNEVFQEGSEIKLSASGLVFKHYGKECIANALEAMFEDNIIPKSMKGDLKETHIDSFYQSAYKGLFVTLDALDNGIERYPKEVKAKFEYYKTDLGSRIARMNPNWWEDLDSDKLYLNFGKAMELCREEFIEKLKVDFMAEVGSSVIVESSVAKNSHGDGQVVVLDKACFWKESLYKTEEKLKISGKIKYVIYPALGGEEFRVQAVAVSSNSFESRKPLKEEWRGLDAEKLASVSGIPDIVFCHHSGFIGGAKSLESSLKMALLSL